jgi:hypothetical protein
MSSQIIPLKGRTDLRESSLNLALQTIRAELRRSDRLTLVLCYARRPGAGLPADKLHRASAHFAARRDERKIRRRLHSWANWSLAVGALSAASKDSFNIKSTGTGHRLARNRETPLKLPDRVDPH